MANKVLVVVDVQNDFVMGGSLAYGYPEKSNTDAIVAKAKEFLSNGDFVIATRDTHGEDYLETLEGQMLPVKHCIDGTRGWQLVDSLNGLTEHGVIAIDKITFGTSQVGKNVKWLIGHGFDIDEIQVVGYCTSICVLSNAVLLRAAFPNMRITVLKDLCGDIDEESHKAALKVLRNQMIEIK